MSKVIASFKHLKLPISIKNTVYYNTNSLHFYDSYISKFDFMRYLYAYLVVVWLYSCRLRQNLVGYEGCSNMNASSFITFFTYMLRQMVNVSIKAYM